MVLRDNARALYGIQCNPFDAILFDFDGVLIDSEPLHCACWAEVLKPLGVQSGVGVL